MKKVLVITLIIIAGFIIWKREPWVETHTTKEECEAAHVKERLECRQSYCDLIQTMNWLDCPHGNKFWLPNYLYAQ